MNISADRFLTMAAIVFVLSIPSGFVIAAKIGDAGLVIVAAVEILGLCLIDERLYPSESRWSFLRQLSGGFARGAILAGAAWPAVLMFTAVFSEVDARGIALLILTLPVVMALGALAGAVVRGVHCLFKRKRA